MEQGLPWGFLLSRARRLPTNVPICTCREATRMEAVRAGLSVTHANDLGAIIVEPRDGQWRKHPTPARARPPIRMGTMGAKAHGRDLGRGHRHCRYKNAPLLLPSGRSSAMKFHGNLPDRLLAHAAVACFDDRRNMRHRGTLWSKRKECRPCSRSRMSLRRRPWSPTPRRRDALCFA